MPNQLDAVTRATWDMRVSKYSGTPEDIKRGDITWHDKRPLNYRTTPRPEHWLSWCRYTDKNGYQDLRDWKFSGWTPVLWLGWTKDNPVGDPYFVEGAELTPEGKFVYGDLIRVKRSFKREIEERLAEQKNIPTGKSHTSKFTTEMKAEGLNVPQDIIDSMLRGMDV